MRVSGARNDMFGPFIGGHIHHDPQPAISVSLQIHNGWWGWLVRVNRKLPAVTRKPIHLLHQPVKPLSCGRVPKIQLVAIPICCPKPSVHFRRQEHPNDSHLGLRGARSMRFSSFVKGIQQLPVQPKGVKDVTRPIRGEKQRVHHIERVVHQRRTPKCVTACRIQALTQDLERLGVQHRNAGLERVNDVQFVAAGLDPTNRPVLSGPCAMPPHVPQAAGGGKHR